MGRVDVLCEIKLHKETRVRDTDDMFHTFFLFRVCVFSFSIKITMMHNIRCKESGRVMCPLKVLVLKKNSWKCSVPPSLPPPPSSDLFLTLARGPHPSSSSYSWNRRVDASWYVAMSFRYFVDVFSMTEPSPESFQRNFCDRVNLELR